MSVYLPETLFINHSTNKISIQSPYLTWAIISFIFLLMLSISIKKKEYNWLDLNTSLSLRGFAIIALVIGHLVQNCLLYKNKSGVEGGFIAVCIFLFLSGYGIAQRYGLSEISIKFWENRLLRLFIPLWLVLILFFVLDYICLGLLHPIWEVILNFSGIMLNGAFIRVNSPAWFVGYIVFQYFIYYQISRIHSPNNIKILLLFLINGIVSIAICQTKLFNYFSIWVQYTLVFPIGVFIGVNKKKVLHNLSIIADKPLCSGTIIIGLIMAIVGAGEYIEQLGKNPTHFIQQFFILVLIVVSASWLKKNAHESKILSFLGKYSYEIFLLHLPFMVKYDFVLFRKPFVVSFFIYWLFVLAMSVALSKLSHFFHAKALSSG